MMKIDEMVSTYIKVREKKSQLKAKYDLDKSKYDDLQKKIEGLLLIKFGEMGVDSVKTEGGTAYTSTLTSASIADWETFFGFIQEHQAYDLLERRVSKTAVEQFKSANEDLPPGINWSESRTVNFRRS